jgi:phage recombination protein Bet
MDMDNKVSPDFLSKDECELLERTMLKVFPEDERQSFLRMCQRTKLDPFTKQIHATRRYQKVKDADGNTKKVPTLVPVTGIMGLCAVAVRTGQYDGCEMFWCGEDGQWKSEWLGEEHPAAAKAIVYRKDWKHPEVGIARWESYVGRAYDYETRQWNISEFWEKMDDYMLGKCAKAQALRGAFPDPLSNLYIHEELDSNLTDAETEPIPADEAKVEESQRRDAELLKTPGVKVVESKPGSVRPTPQEALEPAFEEDRIPEKPKAPPSAPRKPAGGSPPKAAAAPATPPVAAQSKEVPEAPDDLDMSPPPAGEPEPVAQPQEPEAPAAAAATPPWKDHIILGVNHVKFHKRKVGELNAAELAIIENQWLPAVREQWEEATEAQRADATAFEAAIAFNKMSKPW